MVLPSKIVKLWRLSITLAILFKMTMIHGIVDISTVTTSKICEERANPCENGDNDFTKATHVLFHPRPFTLLRIIAIYSGLYSLFQR